MIDGTVFIVDVKYRAREQDGWVVDHLYSYFICMQVGVISDYVIFLKTMYYVQIQTYVMS